LLVIDTLSLLCPLSEKAAVIRNKENANFFMKYPPDILL